MVVLAFCATGSWAFLETSSQPGKSGVTILIPSLWDGSFPAHNPGNELPGYDHSVPPGQSPTAPFGTIPSRMIRQTWPLAPIRFLAYSLLPKLSTPARHLKLATLSVLELRPDARLAQKSEAPQTGHDPLCTPPLSLQ